MEIEEQFAPIYKKYGRRWKPELMADPEDEYCPAAFAAGLQRYIENVFSDNALAERCKNLVVSFRYIENSSVNAVASKLFDDKEEYLVAIFAGVILELKKLYFDKRFLTSIQPELRHLGRLKEKDISRYALYFGSLFIAFHELGHVYRGHLNFFKPSEGQSLSVWDEQAELLCSANSVNSLQSPNRRHLSECDADAFSGTLLAGEIAIHSKNLAKSVDFAGVPQPEMAQDFLILAGCAVHLVFRLFDRKPMREDGDYPCPPIRSAILHGHLMAQLSREGFDANEVTFSNIVALAKAEALADQLGFRKTSTELEAAFKSWKEKYLEALTSLATDLIPYAPCKRS